MMFGTKTFTQEKWAHLPLRTVPSWPDDWKDTFSFARAISVGHGGSGSVFAIDKSKVIKVFSGDEDGQMDLKREREIFHKLQPNEKISSFVVMYGGQWSSGLILERLESTLRQRLMKIIPPSKPNLALHWAKECCAAVKYVHENDVIHGDVGCQNFLISSDNHIKVCDFAGSKLGDSDAWISYEVRSQHPACSGQQPTIQSDIFALGSVIFEIFTSRPPFPSASNLLVRQNYLAGNFPLHEVPDLKVRKIIRLCWMREYESVDEICVALERV